MKKKPPSVGTVFENEIRDICAAYESAGIATIRKVDPPVRVFGRARVLLPNPYLDFVGSMGGRMVMFECKTTEKPRLDIRESKIKGGGVNAQQLANALMWQRAAAVVFFLWQHGNETRILAPEMIEAAACDKSSIAWHDAHPIFGAAENPSIWLDFLASARAIYGIQNQTTTASTVSTS